MAGHDVLPAHFFGQRQCALVPQPLGNADLAEGGDKGFSRPAFPLGRVSVRMVARSRLPMTMFRIAQVTAAQPHIATGWKFSVPYRPPGNGRADPQRKYRILRDLRSDAGIAQTRPDLNSTRSHRAEVRCIPR